MGLECFLGLGCLRTIGWLVVELFCFLGGGGGVGGRISGVQKIFGALQSASGGVGGLVAGLARVLWHLCLIG